MGQAAPQPHVEWQAPLQGLFPGRIETGVIRGRLRTMAEGEFFPLCPDREMLRNKGELGQEMWHVEAADS